jgi:hypothetical protein
MAYLPNQGNQRRKTMTKSFLMQFNEGDAELLAELLAGFKTSDSYGRENDKYAALRQRVARWAKDSRTNKAKVIVELARKQVEGVKGIEVDPLTEEFVAPVVDCYPDESDGACAYVTAWVKVPWTLKDEEEFA